jgi:hypothetical protein
VWRIHDLELFIRFLDEARRTVWPACTAWNEVAKNASLRP